MIYDPADPAFIGVYIESSLCIGSRIKDHIEDLTAAQKYKNMGEKLERKKRRFNTVQMNFWSRRPGLRDFWLVFGQLEMQEGDNKEELAVLLNILEMYAKLPFRTLPPQILRTHQRKGFKMNPYPWTGLNTASPLEQWRRGLGPSTSKPYKFSPRQPASRNVLYRDADPSKGDKLCVAVMCSRCCNPQSYWVDQYPRYEMENGKYLTCVRRQCSYCSSGKSTFIPVDKSFPRKFFTTVQYQHRKKQAKENLPDPTTRTGFSKMAKAELLSWLASQGFTGNKVNFGTKT